jgi:hypothetical protein
MYDAMVVEICNGGEGRAHEIGGVGFVVVTLSANAVEKLASKRKIGDEVNYEHVSLRHLLALAHRTVVHGLKVVDQGEDIPVAHGHPLQHGDLVPDLRYISLVSGVAMRQVQTMCSRPAMSLLLMTFAA